MKKVFVACPIGDETSQARKRSDQLLKHIISPIAQKLGGIEIQRADRIGQPGRISVQILKELRDCDVLIADLSELNPNVLYEFGIRQALVKPYVLMAERGQKLPFDLADLRTIFYQLDLDGVESAQAELAKHLESALNGEQLSVDAELFGRATNESVGLEDETALLQLSETFGVLRAMQSDILDSQLRTEQLIQNVLQNKDRNFEQEMGLLLFKGMLEDPEKFEKILPTFEKIGNLNQKNLRQDDKKVIRK